MGKPKRCRHQIHPVPFSLIEKVLMKERETKTFIGLKDFTTREQRIEFSFFANNMYSLEEGRLKRRYEGGKIEYKPAKTYGDTSLKEDDLCTGRISHIDLKKEYNRKKKIWEVTSVIISSPSPLFAPPSVGPFVAHQL